MKIWTIDELFIIIRQVANVTGIEVEKRREGKERK